MEEWSKRKRRFMYYAMTRGGASSTPATVETTFGNLTIAGHGGVAVTGTTISSGDASGHWTITGGYIVPSAAGDTANLNLGPYALVLDNGQQVNITIAANEWDVRQTSEWGTVIAQATATLSAKKIAIRPGATITTGVDGAAARLRRADFGGLEIYCRDTTTYADVDKFLLRGTRNVTFRRLRTTAVAEIKFNLTGEAANNLAGITIDQCHIRGATGDPNGNYAISTNYPNNGINLIRSSASNDNAVGNVTITNNLIEWSNSAIVLKVSNSAAAVGTITGNRIQYYYSDAITLSPPGNATETGYVVTYDVNDNVISNCVGLSTDSAAPHPDAIRFVATNAAKADCNINVYRNILFPGTARGGLGQGIFASDYKASGVDSGFFYVPKVIGNVVVTSGSTWPIQVENCKNGVALNNTVIQSDANVTGLIAQISLGTGSNGTTSGTHRLERNIADTYNIGGSPTLTDNITSGNKGASLAYSGTFDGPTFEPTSRADVFTMLDMKTGGPADLGGAFDAGAVGSGAINWATDNPGSGGSNNVS
jgi:hypothetical protein